MTLYRKVQKITFENGKTFIPRDGEYALFDGSYLMIVKEEDMSVRVIETDEREFEVILSHEKVEHPLHIDEEDHPLLSGFEEEFEDEKIINFEELQKTLESIFEYFSNIEVEEELNHDIFKKFSIEASDGGKFQIFFGIDIIRKRIVPFLKIQDKSRKIKKTVFKTYLNKTNIKKIFNSIISLKKILDKEIVKSQHNNEPIASSKQKEVA